MALSALSISNRNLNFFNGIKEIGFTEWQVTAIFYAALHLVDHYYRSQKQSVGWLGSHQERDHYISTEQPLESIRSTYRDLRVASEDARYKGRRFSENDVGVYLNRFRTIKNHITGLLGKTSA